MFIGEDGMDSTLLASTVQGGQGGYLINGTGPRGTQGESNNSASGGTGYGAGGGAGGAIYSGDSTKIFSGGNGADGVLYIELVNSGTFSLLLLAFCSFGYTEK